MNVIEISNLSKTFRGKRGARVEAVKELSFSIPRGEIFGFLGPNGAGKSTTIKCLLGLITATSGTAKIMGVDAASHLARKNVGYLPENPAFYDFLTAEEYLRFVGASFSMPEPQVAERSREVLDLIDLRKASNRQIRSYSKGMVQRLGLAQVLLHDPEVYILDEPMSGLDPIGRALVKDIILELKSRGKCVFFSTHITSDVETVCDRVGIIMNGKLQAVEEVRTILARGITGYRIRFTDGETTVARDELPKLLADCGSAGKEVTLIEPERKSLEDFFLDIVQKKSC